METTQQIAQNSNKDRERKLISKIRDLPIVPKKVFIEEENRKQRVIDFNLPIVEITNQQNTNLKKLLK